MKRNDDGYVLPLVLVVLTVLALVASSVLSASLRNVQVQHKAIERMQDKYTAEGAIEIVVAKLEALELTIEPDADTVPDPSESTPTESTPEESTPDESVPDESSPEESTPDESEPAETLPDVEEKFQEEIEAGCTQILGEIQNLAPNSIPDVTITLVPSDASQANDSVSCLLTVTAASPENKITAQLIFEGKLEPNDEKTEYTVESIKVSYKSYQIGGAEE